MRVIDLGLSRYVEALEVQRRVHEEVAQDPSREAIIVTEHYPVYTIGKSGSVKNIVNLEAAMREGIEIVEIDRGGDIFYHGPGQLVVYPIIALKQHGLDVWGYVRLLEEAMIKTIGEFGIRAGRLEGYPGVWVGRKKIGAIGLRVRSGVAMHGLALNVNTNLRHFDYIVACGLHGMGVTSMERELGYRLDMEEVKRILLRYIASLLGVKLVEAED